MIPKDRVLDKLDSLLRANDYQGAKRTLLYWLEEAKYQGDNRGTLLIFNELMGLCRKLGEKEEALKYAQEALNQVSLMDIGNDVGAATTYLNSATVCKAFALPNDALNLYKMAQEIYERELSEKDDRLAGLYNNMGLALVDLKNFREAERLYEKALEILVGDDEKEPERAITYLNLASLVEAESGLGEAREKIEAFCEKALASMEIGKTRTDGNYAFVCEKCASVFGYYGFENYANELMARCRRIYEGT